MRIAVAGRRRKTGGESLLDWVVVRWVGRRRWDCRLVERVRRAVGAGWSLSVFFGWAGLEDQGTAVAVVAAGLGSRIAEGWVAGTAAVETKVACWCTAAGASSRILLRFQAPCRFRRRLGAASFLYRRPSLVQPVRRGGTPSERTAVREVAKQQLPRQGLEGQGTTARMQCFLLSQGSWSRSPSSPTVERLDSWSLCAPMDFAVWTAHL